MTSQKRRDPKLAGVAGITAADIAALDAKRVTLQDLADRCGVSKQGAAKRIKAMRAASPAATSPAPISTGPTIPADAVEINAAEIATSACLGLLMRSHAALVSGDVIGPSGLKALAATVLAATSELRQLGVLFTKDEDTALSTLTVRVMSDTEHDQAKAAAEEMNEFD